MKIHVTLEITVDGPLLELIARKKEEAAQSAFAGGVSLVLWDTRPPQSQYKIEGQIKTVNLA